MYVHRQGVDVLRLRSELATSLVQPCCQRCSKRQGKGQRQFRWQPSPHCSSRRTHMQPGADADQTPRTLGLTPLLSELLIKPLFSPSRTTVSKSIFSVTVGNSTFRQQQSSYCPSRRSRTRPCTLSPGQNQLHTPHRKSDHILVKKAFVHRP